MAKIERYSHYFKVTELDAFTRNLVDRFLLSNTKWSSKVVGWSNGRPLIEKYPDKKFGVHSKDFNQYHFHINHFQEFIDFVTAEHRGVQFDITDVPLYEPLKCDFKINKKWKLRDHQVPLCAYITNLSPYGTPVRQKAAIMQTGKGKSFSALYSIAQLKTRTVLIMKGGFIKQWVNVIKDTYDDLKKGDVLAINGTAGLVSIMNMMREGTLDAKIIIISNRTWQMYIQDWIDTGHDLGIYPFAVDKFNEEMKVGLRINDEVHMHFHLNFLEDLFSHLPMSLGLTATLTPDDPFMDKMYKVMFPMETRFKGVAYEKYAYLIAIHYSLLEKRFARYKSKGMGMYSHITFEQWLMKNKDNLERYLKIIDIVIQNEYIKNKVKGEKMLVFAASIEMCTLLTNLYKKKHPDVKVKRYVEQDPFDNVLSGDLIFSTLISSGTAIDIPGLVRVFMTTALGSSQLNEQAFGRLRNIKTESDLRFVYLTCDDIPQHRTYDDRKKKLFAEKALAIHDYDINIRV